MRVCWMALVWAAVAVSGTVGGAQTPKTNLVTDKPVEVKTIDLSTTEDDAASLRDLTGLPQGEPEILTATTTLPSFGARLCGAYDLCTAEDASCPDAGGCTARRRIYVIHLVDWGLGDGGKIRLTKSSWALYQADGKGRYETVYPKDKVFPNLWDVEDGVLVSVSRLDLGEGRTTETDGTAAPLIEYTVTNTEKKQMWLSGLETLVGGLTGGKFTPNAVGAKRGTASRYRTKIRIMALSAKKLRRPFDVAIAGSAFGSAPGPGECDDLTAQAKCAFSKTLSVVAREYVAFGVNVVPHGPAEAVFLTATNGTVSSKVTRHNAFYGVVDFTPLPRRLPMSRYPYVQAGLPLSGAATHAPYVGMGSPLPVPWLREHLPISVFAGAVFLKQVGPGGVEDRAVKLLWGIEVPIASVTGAIKQVTGR